MNQITALQIAHQNGGTTAFIRKCGITSRKGKRHFKKMVNGKVPMAGYELALICKYGGVSWKDVKIDNYYLSMAR